MTDKQQLDAELTAILPYLPGWQLDPKYAQHTWCAVLRDGTGKGIHVNATQAKGRLYISGMWPADSHPPAMHPRQAAAYQLPATGRRRKSPPIYSGASCRGTRPPMPSKPSKPPGKTTAGPGSKR